VFLHESLFASRRVLALRHCKLLSRWRFDMLGYREPAKAGCDFSPGARVSMPVV